MTDEDHLGRLGLDHRLEDARVTVAGVFPDRITLGEDHFGCALRRGGLRQPADPLADQDRLDIGRLPAGLPGEAVRHSEELEGRLAEGSVLVIAQNQDPAGHLR